MVLKGYWWCLGKKWSETDRLLVARAGPSAGLMRYWEKLSVVGDNLGPCWDVEGDLDKMTAEWRAR